MTHGARWTGSNLEEPTSWVNEKPTHGVEGAGGGGGGVLFVQLWLWKRATLSLWPPKRTVEFFRVDPTLRWAVHAFFEGPLLKGM